MTSRKTVSAVLALLTLMGLAVAPRPALALGRDITLEEITSQHPNQIDWVTTCGAWQADGRNGIYRVVHASLYAQSFLYVQWLETDANGRHEVRHTLSVAELNNDHAEISLERLRCVATRSGASIRARAHFGHESKQGQVEVAVSHAFGRYRFKR